MSKKIKVGYKKREEKFKILNFDNNIIFNSLPQITFLGNSQCCIDGNCSIVEYEETIIKICYKNGCITFIGNNFNISMFLDNKITFDGKILSVEFSN